MQHLFAKDVYYHNKCRLGYMRRYEESMAECVLCKKTVNRKSILSCKTVTELLQKSRLVCDTSVSDRILDCYDEQLQQMKIMCYSHELCKTKYLGTIDLSKREIYIKHVVPLVKDMLKNGYYLTISEIRDRLQEIYTSKMFYNNTIKKFLEEYSEEFSAPISFCKPYKNNDSTIIYPSYLTTEQIVARIQNLNLAKSTLFNI